MSEKDERKIFIRRYFTPSGWHWAYFASRRHKRPMGYCDDFRTLAQMLALRWQERRACL